MKQKICIFYFKKLIVTYQNCKFYQWFIMVSFLSTQWLQVILLDVVFFRYKIVRWTFQFFSIFFFQVFLRLPSIFFFCLWSTMKYNKYIFINNESKWGLSKMKARWLVTKALKYNMYLGIYFSQFVIIYFIRGTYCAIDPRQLISNSCYDRFVFCTTSQ